MVFIARATFPRVSRLKSRSLIIFEISKRIGSSQRSRSSGNESRSAVSVKHAGAIFLPSHRGERRPPPAGKSKSQRTYALGSAPKRRGYRWRCAVERIQFPRGLLARRSRQVSLSVRSLRTCVYLSEIYTDVYTFEAERCARRYAILIAPKSRFSHWVSTRFVSKFVRNMRRIIVVREVNRRIYASKGISFDSPEIQRQMDISIIVKIFATFYIIYDTAKI